VAPGEQITQEAVDVITRYRQMSLPVQGVDHDAITILKLC
jgi:arginine/lysine/ornithine decarboxylase